jgi:hypothetical protein
MSKASEEYSKEFDSMHGDNTPDLSTSKAEQVALERFPVDMTRIPDKVTKFYELQNKMHHYKWLCDIAREYKSMIDCIKREKEFFIIYGFSYSARSDIRTFKVNPHRTIPYSFIKDGLSAALADIEKEIAEEEKELKDWL